MKNFMMMIGAGALGAGLTLTFTSKSFESTATAQAITEAIRTNMCSVRVGYQRITTGGRCFTGEVMTGIMNDYIYCSDITVTCLNDLAAEAN